MIAVAVVARAGTSRDVSRSMSISSMEGIGSSALAASANNAAADFLLRGQRALIDHGLIDDTAAPEVADRHDQTSATIAIAKIELARIRPPAAVLSLGMCPEPAPINPDNLIQRARHRDGAYPKRVWPALLLPATNSDPENGDSGIHNR